MGSVSEALLARARGVVAVCVACAAAACGGDEGDRAIAQGQSAQPTMAEPRDAAATRLEAAAAGSGPDAPIEREAAGSMAEQADPARGARTGRNTESGAASAVASVAEVAGHGFTIEFDYQFDTMGGFDDTQRRALLDYAAAQFEAYIASEFDDISAGSLLRARHPEAIDEPGMRFSLDYAIDDLVIIVAYADIDGLHGKLGWTSTSLTTEGYEPTVANCLRERFYQTPYQPWIAQTTFDLSEPWYYDPTPTESDDIPRDRSDFLTTAMHEVGHALGLGNSEAWERWVSEGEFHGPRAVEVYGGPVPLADDSGHFARDTTIDGARPVMEMGTADGERKLPTRLDLAALEDIGYDIDWDAFSRR